MRAKLSTIVATTTLLAACGGASDDDSTSQPSKDYNQLRKTPQSAQALQLADGDAVKQHITNGLRLELSSTYGGVAGGSSSGAAVPSVGGPEAVDGASDANGRFSDTNVHVDGVDEADISKYDGSHWFIANAPRFGDPVFEGDTSSAIDIVATDPAGLSAEIVARVQLDEQWGQVGEMYLLRDGTDTSHIAYVRNQRGNVMPFLPGAPIDMQILAEPAVIGASDALYWQPENGKIQVQLVDVSTPSAPTDDWRLELDGSLIDSRKIGDTLYLVTRFDPWLSELMFEYGDPSVREHNEQILANADVDQLMPHYYVNDRAAPLAEDCYLQADTKEHFGYRHLVHITAVDLAGKTVIGSTCINSGVEALSMSPSNLYLTGTAYNTEAGANQTVVHKFALTAQGAEYKASGNVRGSLPWSSDPAFRMHESGEHLRIVTTEATDTLVHRLTILEDTGAALAPLATLPNAAQPASIGKPGEDIYSVRFQGDNAYIVTFRRTDPLYAIDLSDPANPRIAGELEIPGFATYMHPLPNDHLFTLGYDADDTGRTGGIKAELIRVVDGTPEVLDTFIFGGAHSYSEALQNLRALSVLNVDEDETRFAFPTSIYGDDYAWQYSGLQMMQVDGLSTGEASLSDAGTLVADTASASVTFPTGYGTTRGLLHDDAVFFTYDRGIWSAPWGTPEQALGPVYE